MNTYAGGGSFDFNTCSGILIVPFCNSFSKTFARYQQCSRFFEEILEGASRIAYYKVVANIFIYD